MNAPRVPTLTMKGKQDLAWVRYTLSAWSYDHPPQYVKALDALGLMLKGSGEGKDTRMCVIALDAQGWTKDGRATPLPRGLEGVIKLDPNPEGYQSGWFTPFFEGEPYFLHAQMVKRVVTTKDILINSLRICREAIEEVLSDGSAATSLRIDDARNVLADMCLAPRPCKGFQTKNDYLSGEEYQHEMLSLDAKPGAVSDVVVTTQEQAESHIVHLLSEIFDVLDKFPGASLPAEAIQGLEVHAEFVVSVADQEKWAISTDGENYGCLLFDSKREAIAEGWATFKDGFYVGKVERPTPPEDMFEARDWLEHVGCQDEYAGDHAEDWDESTEDQRKELTLLVRQVMAGWLERHGLRPRFFNVTDCTKYSVDEQGDIVDAVEVDIFKTGDPEMDEEIKTALAGGEDPDFYEHGDDPTD